jgi:hypothetical protein
MKLGITDIIDQITAGKDLVTRTYTKQYWENFKLNYEFVYRAYFLKIAQMMDSATER